MVTHNTFGDQFAVYILKSASCGKPVSFFSPSLIKAYYFFCLWQKTNEQSGVDCVPHYTHYVRQHPPTYTYTVGVAWNTFVM